MSRAPATGLTLRDTQRQSRQARPRPNLREVLARGRKPREPRRRGRPRSLPEDSPLRPEIDAFATAQAVRLNRATLSGYLSTLDDYANFLSGTGRAAWSDVTEDDAAAFLRSLRGRGFSLHTVVTYTSHLTAFHTFLRYRRGGPRVVI